MGSTPSRDPSTTSSRLASTNATTCAAGGRAPLPEESRSPLQDLVGPAQLPNLLLQRLHPRGLVRAHPPHLAGVDLGLLDPRADRLDPVAQLRSDALHRAVLG